MRGLGLSRELWVVQVGIFLNTLGWGVVLPFEIIYLHNGRGFSLSTAGQRVLIVDDHRGFRGLARRLVEEIGLDVVGEASSGAQALLEERRLRPDIVLLDIQLPDLDGFAVASSLRSVPAAPTVVLVSTREASDYGPRVRQCGALGFISKAELSSASLAAMLSG